MALEHGDGIDDGYEISVGMNPLNPADAALDLDGDGFPNLTEYQWCTPLSLSNGLPTSIRLIARGAGSNELRRIATVNDNLAMGDTGPGAALVRVRPFLKGGTNLIGQRLYHTRTPGMYINGTAASSLTSPIDIPAGMAQDFCVTADVSAGGTNLGFTLTDATGYTGLNCRATFEVPKLSSVRFTGLENRYSTVSYGQSNSLCYSSAHTRGIPFAQPVAHTVQVGIDFDDNGVLDSGEVSQTCVVYPLRINIGVDTDRNGVIDTADEPGKATNTLTRGALLPPPLRPILATNNSLAGLASIRVDVEPRAAVPGMGLRLVRKAEQSSAELSLINRFGAALPSGYSFKLGNWPTSGIPIYAAPPYARPGAFSPTNHWPKCVTRSGTLESGSLLYETRRSTALPGRLCAPFFLTEASCRVQQ